MSWYQVRGELPYKEWADNPKVVEEKPLGLWKQVRGELPHKDWAKNPDIINELPLGLWLQKRGELPHKKCFNDLHLGACYNSKNLVDVVIPSTVNKIGPYAFAGTCIKTVSVCSSCIYEETSFPKECEVCIEEVI